MSNTSNRDNRVTELEIQVSHQTRVVEELSDVVARQAEEISRLQRQMKLLLEQAAETEAGAGSVVIANQKPPHW